MVNDLMSVFIDKRQNCSEIFYNLELWSLCFDDVADDLTVKAYVSNTKQTITKEDNFIQHLIKTKSKERIKNNKVRIENKLIETKQTKMVSTHFKQPLRATSKIDLKLNEHKRTEQQIFTYPKQNDLPPQSRTINRVFLSYVRKEAYKYARVLKIALNRYGIRVYLDVDEIKPGNDWQNDLNSAIIECDIFVALITPNYGNTRWTRREIQLGDHLHKHIVPINFLDHWPPITIAINLLATHFISWKTDEEIQQAKTFCDTNQPCDTTNWDDRCVRRIAKKIEDKLRSINSLSLLSSRV